MLKLPVITLVSLLLVAIAMGCSSSDQTAVDKEVSTTLPSTTAPTATSTPSTPQRATVVTVEPTAVKPTTVATVLPFTPEPVFIATSTPTTKIESSTPTEPSGDSSPKLSEPDAAEDNSFATVPDIEINCSINPDVVESSASTGSGVWLQIRGDRALTGKSDLVGNIGCPKLLWSHDLGAQISLVELTLDSSVSSTLKLPTGGQYGNSWQTSNRFEMQGRMVDMDGDGKQETRPPDGGKVKVGDLLPERPGLEQVTCDSGEFQTGAGGQDPLPCYLMQVGGETPEILWTSQPFKGFTNNMSTTGQPIIGDFDADGEMEIAVLPWYDIQVLDLKTGSLEYTGNYQPADKGASVCWKSEICDPTTGRPYGFFGAYDLGGDARSEFLILGDFEMFVSVLGWKGDELVELWDHQIEAGTTQNSAVHETGVSPVGDIDGDGLPEIVTSIYNETGDGRWHVIGFDGLTGEIKIDIADRHLASLGDIDSDHVFELFLTETRGAVIPDFGPIEIVSATGTDVSVIWRRDHLGFEKFDIPIFPDNVNSRSTWGRRTIFLDNSDKNGLITFITRSLSPHDSNVTLDFFQTAGDSLNPIASVTGPDLRLRGVDPTSDELKVVIQADATPSAQSLVYTGVSATLVSSERNGGLDPRLFLTGSVIAPMQNNATPLIVVQGYDKTLYGLDVSSPTGAVEVIWSTSGRGMISGSDVIVPNQYGYASIAMADIRGNGKYIALAADKGEGGQAILKAIDHDGTSVWEATFNLPGDPPIWNVGGITHWTAGHFLDNSREDVLVSVRPTKMHSDHLYLLDGRTGETVWQREKGGRYSCDNVTGAGAGHVALVDWDNDGLDDIVDTYSGMFVIYSGKDGSMLRNRWTTSWCDDPLGLFEPGFLKHPLPVAEDFLGDGTTQVLLSGIDAAIAVIDSVGNLSWSTDLFSGSPNGTMQGLGDTDSDGNLDIISVGHCNTPGSEIQVFEASTALIRWSVDINEICKRKYAPTHVVTGDIDGDGRDEFLFTHANVVYAFGEDGYGIGREEWRATFEKNTVLGALAIADTNGSARPQIIVNTSSGHVIGLGE